MSTTTVSKSREIVHQSSGLPSTRSSSGRQLRLGRLGIHAILILGVVVMAFPFIWMLSTSVKTQAEALTLPPSIFPQEWHFDNYLAAWNAAPFARYFLNTTIVAGATVVAVLFTSILAAYAFAFMDFRGKNALFIMYLSTMMIPFETIMIPNFIIVHRLGWGNTYFGLFMPFAASVFGVFLLRQFFLSLPRELADAAVIDGCGQLGYLWRIALPLATPAVAVVALFNFLASWNGLLWPLIVTDTEDMRTVQLGLSVFLGEASTNYPLLMAAACFCMAPIIALYLFTQRQFIEGIAAGGVKG